MFYLRRAVGRAGLAVTGLVCIAFTLLVGCANKPSTPDQASAQPGRPDWMPADPPAGFFIPVGLFGKSASPGVAAPSLPLAAQVPAAPALLTAASSAAALPPVAWVPTVLLYASPTTESYLASGGLDAKANLRVWEVFLKKYKIPYQLVTAVDRLEAEQSGVLLLPTSVALTQREKQAVVNFRAKGGNVLASWLVGVRSENGTWLGFNFMENALDAKVMGNTQAEEEDNFMMPYGDNPVTHHLPAGMRIWLEPVKETYPLRLLGRYPAAQIMDWSRTFVPDKAANVIVFDERVQASGRPSRSVVLGYPERLWLSSDPRLLEAIAHNALLWLLRQPDVYIAAWPQSYTSALVLAVDASDVFSDTDVSLGKSLKDKGIPATYYAMSEIAQKSAPLIKQIQAQGHEFAYLGDRFIGFKDQPVTTQVNRLNNMRNEMRTAGVAMAPDAGFHAPMESYDKTTEKLLRENGFGHYVSFMDGTDARLPFLAPANGGTANASARPTVVLPRTQNGPEDAMETGEPEEGLKLFMGELELAQKMGGLSIIRLSQQGFLTKEQLAQITDHLKAQQKTMWMATAGQVADWWRERERVSIKLEPNPIAPLLTVTVNGATPLAQAVSVHVNLPVSGGVLRLVPNGHAVNSIKTAALDAWRTAVQLKDLAPGTYRWHLYFDRPATSNTQ